jgi:O-acetyl-ADP-ribose deacetylase (regulator of RNase III)
VITSGLRLRAKYIIHAVGPIYQDGHHNERELLYSAYQSALKLAVQYDCRSVGFPLISAGIYGYPVDEAWTVATEACSDFIRSHPETDIKIIFAVLNNDMLAKGKAALQKVQ